MIHEGCAYAIGKLRQDESSHWYLVPDEEVVDFDELSDRIEDLDFDDPLYYEASNILYEELNSGFGKYRLDGGVEGLDVIIK